VRALGGSDADFDRAAGEHVLHPLCTRPEAGHDDRLGQLVAPAEHLEHGPVQASAATAAVRQQQEAVPEQRAGSRVVHDGGRAQCPGEGALHQQDASDGPQWPFGVSSPPSETHVRTPAVQATCR
jgi:hypothetical protein